MNRTAVLGLLGGIGSGKTTVASEFKACGAIVLDADDLVHEALGDPEILLSVVDVFGESILRTDGTIDRKALGKVVFSSRGKRKLSVLEGIIHPHVREIIIDQLNRAKRDSHPLVVLDIPLLLNSPLAGECDSLLFVDASRACRLKRVADRGWNETELDRREALQPSLQEKKRCADATLINEGDLGAVRAEVRKFYHSLISEEFGESHGQDSQEEENNQEEGRFPQGS